MTLDDSMHPRLVIAGGHYNSESIAKMMAAALDTDEKEVMAKGYVQPPEDGYTLLNLYRGC